MTGQIVTIQICLDLKKREGGGIFWLILPAQGSAVISNFSYS